MRRLAWLFHPLRTFRAWRLDAAVRRVIRTADRLAAFNEHPWCKITVTEFQIRHRLANRASKAEYKLKLIRARRSVPKARILKMKL